MPMPELFNAKVKFPSFRCFGDEPAGEFYFGTFGEFYFGIDTGRADVRRRRRPGAGERQPADAVQPRHSWGPGELRPRVEKVSCQI